MAPATEFKSLESAAQEFAFLMSTQALLMLIKIQNHWLRQSHTQTKTYFYLRDEQKEREKKVGKEAEGGRERRGEERSGTMLLMAHFKD